MYHNNGASGDMNHNSHIRYISSDHSHIPQAIRHLFLSKNNCNKDSNCLHMDTEQKWLNISKQDVREATTICPRPLQVGGLPLCQFQSS